MDPKQPPSLESLQHQNEFIERHIGQTSKALTVCSMSWASTLWKGWLKKPSPLPLRLISLWLAAAMNEETALAALKQLPAKINSAVPSSGWATTTR